MRKDSSGIRIYEQTIQKCRGGKNPGAVWLVHALSVWSLAAAWWNASLSVFPAEVGNFWLYGALAVFAVGLAVLHRKSRLKAVPCVFLVTGIVIWAGWTLFGEFFERVRESWMVMIYEGTVQISGFPADLAFGPERMFVIPGEALMGLAGAVVTIPLLELWTIVLRTGKGRLAAGIFMPIPFLAAAAAGYFQSELPAWLLILAAGSYFGVCQQISEKGKRHRNVMLWGRYLGGAVLLCAAVFLSVNLGRVLDGGREAPEGAYQKVRAGIQSGIIVPLESFVYDAGLDETEDEPAGDGDMRPENREPQEAEEEFGARSLQIVSAMGDLKGLAYFRPSGMAEQTVRLEERPAGTVYIAERYGITYTGDAWSDMAEEGLEGRALIRKCTSYPEGLDQLESLCSGWESGSLEEIRERISVELSGLAVYDVSPGPTPADRDFVEYFLFERGSGFCVHFASAAVLLYRMNGFPARYAEGYAVPASAFSPAEGGGYEAQVNGMMGHAWCQVYNEENGGWINMEHTPGNAASDAPSESLDPTTAEEQETLRSGEQGADESEAQRQSAETQESEELGVMPGENTSEKGASGVWLLPALAAVSAALAVFSAVFIQAVVRRSRNRKRFLEEKAGGGIIAMYESMVKTASFLGFRTARLTERENVEHMCRICPEVKREEWIWMYEKVMESLFYHLEDEGGDRDKAERLCHRFQKAAMERMGRRKRVIYRYVCVYTMWK